MKENTTKPTKKRRLLFWLTLAACLLIIAAIIVGIVFATRGNGSDLTIDNPPQNQQGNSNSGNQKPPVTDTGDKDKDGDNGETVDTSSQYEFISPIENVSLIKSHEFAYDKTMGWYRLHQAIDFEANAGTDVLAAVDGTVTSIEVNNLLDYAVVKISHANDLTTVYKFIDPAENLKVGQTVNRGQVIGKVAVASGRENADGDHLHFEVYKANKCVDPEDYLNLNSK